MHSLTNTLMSGVHKPGFPKCGRLVGGRKIGHEVSQLSQIPMLVMWKLTFCHKLSITSPSYQVRKTKKVGGRFSPCKTFVSNLLTRNYIWRIKKNFRFLILGCKKCSERNFVPSFMGKPIQSHFKPLSAFKYLIRDGVIMGIFHGYS